MRPLNLEKFKKFNIFKKFTHNKFFVKLSLSYKNRPKVYINRDFITFLYLLLSLLVLLATIFYTAYYFKELPSQIPLWYSLNWGPYRLSIKQYIYIIPALTFVLYIFSIFFCFQYLKTNIKEVARFISTITFLCVLFLSFSTHPA